MNWKLSCVNVNNKVKAAHNPRPYLTPLCRHLQSCLAIPMEILTSSYPKVTRMGIQDPRLQLQTQQDSLINLQSYLLI